VDPDPVGHETFNRIRKEIIPDPDLGSSGTENEFEIKLPYDKLIKFNNFSTKYSL
jgi:hypothetical protein